LIEYIEFLDFDLSSAHFNKMKNTNIFSAPSFDNAPVNSYFTQMKAPSGQHSVIIYDPNTNMFYARNILVDLRIHNMDIAPKYKDFQQIWDKHNYKIFMAQKILDSKTTRL
jgi:hypothetical protein